VSEFCFNSQVETIQLFAIVFNFFLLFLNKEQEKKKK